MPKNFINLLLISLSLTSLANAELIPIDVYIGPLGQSNAVGKFGPVPSRLNSPQQHEYYYWIDGGAGNLTVGSGQLAPTYGYGAVFGSELSFGESFTEKIAIIKVAKSGSPIDEWARDGVMYSQLQATVTASIADLVSKGFNPTIRGGSFTQGEYNSGSAEAAANYETKLTQLIADLRTDFGPDFRFVYNQLHVDLPNHWPALQWVGDIRQAQENVARSVDNVRMINADDLQLDPRDYLHFSPAMQDILGQRISIAMTNPADVDVNGTVDGADFLAWQRFDTSASTLQAWTENYPSISSVTMSIPEPTTNTAMVIAIIMFVSVLVNVKRL